MPQYSVRYFTEVEWEVIVNADSYEDAAVHWCDSAYWDSEPEALNEDMGHADVYIEEME